MPRRKVESSGILAERTRADGARRLKLTDDEARELRRKELVEKAVACYLDVTRDWTQAQIATYLGLTLEELKSLTRSEEFDAAYNEHFIELGHDPRLKAAQAAIVDMLPLALRELKSILTNPQAAEGVKLKAVEKVLALGGIEQPKPAQNDKRELAEFLQSSGVNIENMNIYQGLPREFTDPLAFSRNRGLDLDSLPVEGQVLESEPGAPSEPPPAAETGNAPDRT